MFVAFEWDSRKQLANLEKHGIDFEDAARIFLGGVVTLPGHSGQSGERRFVAVGSVDDCEIAVVYTERHGVCRLISARRARKSERTAYRKAFPTESPQGQD